MKNISVGQILEEACDVFEKDIKKISILALQSLVLTFVLFLICMFIEKIIGLERLPTFQDSIVEWISGALFILAVHRYRLIGWGKDTKWLLRLRLGKRELYFFACIAIIKYAVTWTQPHHYGLYSWMPDTVFVSIVLIAVLSLVFILPRFLLILPATADDQPHPISFGTHLGKGIYWKLFWIMEVPSIVIYLIKKYVILPIPVIVVQDIFLSIIAYALTAFIAIALCLIYKQRLDAELPIPLTDSSS